MQSYSDFVREKNKKQSDSEANNNKVQSYSDFVREKNKKQTNSKPVNESEIKDKIKPGNPIHTLPAPLQIAEKMRTSAISSIDTALKQPVVSALHKSAKTEQIRRNALENNKDDDKDVEFGFTWFDDNGLVVEGTKEQAQKRLTRKQEIKNEYNYLDDDVMADLRIMAEGLNAEPMTKGLTGAQVAIFGGEEYSNYTQRIADAEKARKRLKDKGYSSLQVDTWAKMQQEGINQQYAADLQQGFDEMAKEHPALSSFASVGVKLATTPLDAATKIDEAASGNINTNGIVDIASQTDDMIRSSVAKDIEEESEIGAWLYNVGMSGVDSAVASVMPGGFLFLATDAATSTMRELTNRGLSTEQAFFGGVAAGVFEGLFERVSIKNFDALQEVSPLSVKDVVKNILKSTGVNFTEEAATELANIVYDTIAHGDLSQLNLLAEKYDGDYAKAFGELALQVGEAGLSGAVMGSGFGVTGSAIGYASNYGDIKTTGRQVKAEGIADLILEQGKSAPQKSRPNQAYQHAQKKLDKGKGLSDRDIGLVAYENLQYAQENAPKLNGVFESAESLQDVEALYNAERYRLNYQVPISKEQTDALKALEADYKTAKSSIEKYNKSGARAMFDSSLRENTFTETDTVKTKMPDIGKTKEGEVVSVASIENIEDGKITVKTSEGTTQALDIKKDIKSVDAQTLWTNATKNFTDAASAQAYIENYDGGSIADYTKAFNDYYNLAATGLTLERINEQEIAPYYDLSEQAQAAAVEMGRKSMAFKKGVVDLTVRPKTKAQQLQINMLDAIGKHTGLNFVVVENMKDEGFYKTGSNQVVLSLGSSKGLVLRTAGHETYHYVQTTLSDRAKDIETFVLDTLKNNKGEKWVNDRLKYYEKLGYEGKQKQINELVADSLFDAFTNKRAVEQFAIKDQSLAQKISNHIKQLIADIKNIINKVIASGDYAEITAWQDDLASLEKLNNMFLDVLDELAVSQELQKADSDDVFSLNRSVEETKDLVAVHNITEQQLFDVLQRGKLIAPSLAVTNLGHTGFADISLVFNKETIDPLSSKENKLFGADAWTPTQTTLKKGARFDGNKVSKTISDIKSLIGSRYVGELFDVNVKQFEEAIRKADGSVYSAYSENIGMQTAYALEKGFVSKLPTTRGMLDKTALKEQLDTVLHADKNWRAYKRWLNDISDSVIKGFNTATNEDILNNMKAQPVSAKPFKLTESGELFVPAAEYAGIEDMRQNKHRLSKSAEAETKKVATKLMSFANRLGKAKGVDSKTVIKAINNSFENRYNTKDIAKSFGLNGIEISNSIARDLQALYKEAVELPTPYFEAKPLRDVGVSEVAMAILPDTSSNELKTLLKENGIPYQEYENGNDDSRIKALNSVDEVKFSRNRDSSISEEASDYILDTKEYQEILDIVDQRFEATGRKELSPKAIDRLAGKLLTKSKSNYSRERLTERLTALFDYIANSRDLEWSEVTSIAAEISKDVLKDSQTLDRSMQTEYADVLKLMRESKVYISPEVKQEIAYSFGSYESFKRMLGNKLNVTVTDTSAVPLDVFWRELSENRPEMFDADTNYLDMPSAIVDFLDMTSPQYVNPYDIEMDMDEAAYDFALQIYDEYFNIPEVISETKKHQYEIERLKGKYNAKINELHNTYRERIKKLRKEKNNKIEATKELYRQRHEAYREKRNETQNKQKLRASIYRTSKALVDKLVNPTDQKHIPQELISSVNEFAKAITESGVFTPDRAMRLKKAFKAIGENGTDADANLSTMYNEEFAEMFEELQDTIAGRKLTELNSSELETVRDTIKYVAHVVSMSNRAFSDGIKERLGVLQNDALEEFSKQNPDRKRVKFEIQKGLLKPVTFFELIESPTMMKLYQNIRQGEGKWYNTIASAKKRRQDAADKFNYKSWKKDTITIKPERFGGNVVLSIDEALSIYATANRQQGVDHLLLGGIVREEDAKKKLDRKKKAESVDVRSDNIPLTIKDISEITSKLTKEQRGYADSLVEYMSTDMASLGNEVSMRLFGIKKFNEQKYFPLKSASNFLFSKPAVESDARIKHMSMTKPTTPKANNPVVIGNFTETVMNHCNDMALYYSFCLPLEDFNRVYNFKTQPTTLERPTSIKQKIDAAYGSKANSYIKQLLTDINGGVTQQAGTGFVNKMIAKAKKNAVFGSLSVAVQQPSAIARAFLYVDPKYFVSSTFNKRDWDELKKYAPVAGVKEMGYFDTNVGKQAVDWMSEDGYDGLKEKAFALFKDKDYRDDKLSFLPSYMDRITWGHIWNAVKKETAHNNPNMDVKSEEFLTLAGKRFTFVIDRTQVYDSVFARSEWMRSKDTGVKVATAFMSEPLTNYNMLYSAAVKARHGDVKFGAKALSAYLVSVAFNSLLKALVTAGRDDDEDKSYWEKYLSHVVGNFVDEPFGMVPYLKDFVSLLQGYDSKRMDTQALADIADAVMTVFNEDKSGWEKFKSAFGAVGIAAGIPFKNLVRDGEMIYRGVKDIYDGKKQPTTEKGIEYAIKEELGFDVPTKYDQLVEAYLEGDYAHYKKVDNNLKASMSDKAISSGIKTAVKGKYQSGTITDNQAIDILEEMLGLEEDDAYWQIQEWDNADNEDWSKYSDFYSAIDSNKNLQATIKTYTDNGVTTKTLSSQITGHYKEQYIELYKTDRVAASKLKSKLVEVYALLGYKRADKSKDIDAWLKPQK